MNLKHVLYGILLFLSMLRHGMTAEPDKALAQADAYFQSSDWRRAEEAYQAITENDPTNGQAWIRLGACLHEQGRFEEALGCYDHAEKAGFPAPGLQIRRARAYARLGRGNEALTTLEKLAQGGFAGVKSLQTEHDFDGLRELSRFKKALETVQRAATPCKYAPEFRQLDFWLGEWDVVANGQTAGTSSVQLILDDCVVLENWTGASGYSGKSFNLYEPTTRQWQQHWVDNAGAAIDFTGSYEEGQLKYRSDATATDGTRTLGRMTFFKLPDGNVRQLWEQSTDAGKTWSIAFDGLYTRRK